MGANDSKEQLEVGQRLIVEAEAKIARLERENRELKAGRSLSQISSIDAIVVPAPRVPFGPEGVSPNVRDARYLREAVKNIDHASARGKSLWGSNLTATVRKLLLDASAALELKP